MLGTTVDGLVTVNNGADPTPATGGGTTGGDSYTQIINCVFEGGSGSLTPALTITNGDGNNQTFIQGQTPVAPQTTSQAFTQIGGADQPVNTGGFTVVITNGIGGSNVTFTNGGVAASTPVVAGGVQVNNGNVLPLQSNQVSFVGSLVYGGVDVENDFGGTTNTSVQSSRLGASLVWTTPASSTIGAPVEVNKSGGGGTNIFHMTASQLPWGLYINNTPTSGNPVSFGNQTIVDSSFIGETSTGAHPLTSSSLLTASPAAAGDSAYISGSGGPDTVVVRKNTVIMNALDLNHLGTGNKQVAVDSSTLGGFNLTADAGLVGTTALWLGGATIQTEMNVTLDGGGNTIWFQKGNSNLNANSFPDPLAGSYAFNGGLQNAINNLYYDSIADVPPANTAHVVETVATVVIPSWALVSSNP